MSVLGCTNAQLVSALNNEDQGTHNVANALFSLPSPILNAAFGNPKGGANFGGDIPSVGTGAIKGDPACLARCAGKSSN